MGRKKIITDRRGSILQAADELFNHYGVEKTTMDDISRMSKVPRATVYLEFSGGKEDIMMTLIKNYFDQLLGQFYEIAEKAKPQEHLNAIATMLILYSISSYQRAKWFLEFQNIERYSKRIRLELTDFFDQQQVLIENQLQSAINSHEMGPCDASALTTMLNHVAITYSPLHSSKMSEEELASNATLFFQTLLAGIKFKNSP